MSSSNAGTGRLALVTQFFVPEFSAVSTKTWFYQGEFLIVWVAARLQNFLAERMGVRYYYAREEKECGPIFWYIIIFLEMKKEENFNTILARLLTRCRSTTVFCFFEELIARAPYRHRRCCIGLSWAVSDDFTRTNLLRGINAVRNTVTLGAKSSAAARVTWWKCQELQIFFSVPFRRIPLKLEEEEKS